MALEWFGCVLVDDLDVAATEDSFARAFKSLGKPSDQTTDLRKFIVLKSAKKLYLVLGPTLLNDKSHPSYYTHRRLRETALEALYKSRKLSLQISGGGFVVIDLDFLTQGWQAKLMGNSDDFGVYDPELLKCRSDIVRWFGMKTTFDWKDIVDPRGRGL